MPTRISEPVHTHAPLQEMLEKAPQMPKDVQWHFIGHLQSNKVKAVLGKYARHKLQQQWLLLAPRPVLL